MLSYVGNDFFCDDLSKKEKRSRDLIPKKIQIYTDEDGLINTTTRHVHPGIGCSFGNLASFSTAFL